MRLSFPQYDKDTKADADKDLAAQGVVLVDATLATVKVKLPPVDENPGNIIVVKRADGSGNSAFIVTPDGATIDGQPNLELAAPYSGAAVFSDGTQWLVLFKI